MHVQEAETIKTQLAEMSERAVKEKSDLERKLGTAQVCGKVHE